jgi:hypothetical protein
VLTLWRKTKELRRKSRKETTAKKARYWIQAFFSTADTGGVYLR